jgi:hypothetical protein
LLKAKGRLIRTPELFLTVQQTLGLNVTLARPSAMCAGVDAVGRLAGIRSVQVFGGG